MRAVETMVSETGGRFCVGDTPTIADICLTPQVYAAKRFNVDLSGVDRLLEVYERCIALDAFKKAHPDNQPDAVKG
jgi:glutathione S-transferase